MDKGLFEEAIPYHDTQIDRAPDDTKVPSYNLACCYALTGNVDKAFGWLLKAEAAGFVNTTHMAGDASMDSLREDPRYKAIVARMDGKGDG